MNITSSDAVLRTEGLVKRYGGLTVTDHVTLDIRPGELHAVIGPNGAGKTSLINQLSGETAPNAGKVWFQGHDVTDEAAYKRARRGLLRSYQVTSIFEEFTVLENAMLSAIGSRGHAYRFWKPMIAPGAPMNSALAALESTGLSALTSTMAGELGYGQRRQLELAMALAASPRFLLLDEPMAGMSAEESVSVVKLLQRLKGTYPILLIEHDMDAVFALADRITVLVYGRIAFCGTPDEVRNNAEVKAIYLGDEQADFDEEPESPLVEEGLPEPVFQPRGHA
jgi:branched-chain amino acid transport system ATP-binding protein